MSVQAHADVQAEKAAIRLLLETVGEQQHTDLYAGKRETTRYAADVRLEVLLDLRGTADVLPAMLHNIGASGMAFWSRRPVDIKPDIQVRAFAPDGDSTWIGADVTHCTRGLNGFLIGVTFHHPLAPGDLPEIQEPEPDVTASEPEPAPPPRRSLLSRLGIL